MNHEYNKEVLFNLDGKKIEENEYIPDGTLANRTVYLYQKDRLIEYNNYDSQGILFGTGKYSYKEDGELARLNYKSSDGTFNWSEAYKHDAQGNVIEVTRFKLEEVIDSKEVYSFDEYDNLSSSTYYKKGELIAKNNYNYNAEGDFTELNYSDDSVFSYKYNYDEKGNWIKQIVFENENPSGVLTREIEYFD